MTFVYFEQEILVELAENVCETKTERLLTGVVSWYKSPVPVSQEQHAVITIFFESLYNFLNSEYFFTA